MAWSDAEGSPQREGGLGPGRPPVLRMLFPSGSASREADSPRRSDASAASVAADPSLREWSGARVRRWTVEEPVTGAGKDDDRPVLAAFAFE